MWKWLVAVAAGARAADLVGAGAAVGSSTSAEEGLVVAVLSSPIGRLRLVALVEAVSYLALLGVAMPLKYVAGMPMAVKIVGWIHGGLFVLLCVALAHVWRSASWRFGRVLMVFVAALLPFGPFVIDRRLKEEDEQRAQ